ncbi:MAG: ABC transporter ATP-binding protein, partial [Pseudomonadota bacterium]
MTVTPSPTDPTVSHKPIEATWRDVMSLCAVYWFSQPRRLALVMVFVFIMVAADILFPIIAGLLVDRIVTAIDTGQGFDLAYQMLYMYMAVLVIFFVVKNIRFRVWNILAARNMAQLLEDTFAKVQKFSSDWHANTFAGATVRKITRGKWAYDTISEILWMNFLPQSLMVIGVTAVMIARYPSVGLMFALGVVVHVTASVLVASQYVRPANVRAAGADSAIGAAVADSITNNAAVKSFGAEVREEARFRVTVMSWRERAIIAWTRGWDLIFVQQVIWRIMQ